MTANFDEADYLSPHPNGPRGRPAWLRLGLPIAGIFALSLGAAAAYGLTAPKVYEAQARVELIVPEGADAETMPVASERLMAARSSAVAARTVSQLGLVMRPQFIALDPSLQREGAEDAALQSRAAAIVLESTGTAMDENGIFASITYRAPSPRLAADIANGLALEFLAEDGANVAAALGDSREELEELVAQIRAELDISERALATGMTDADIIAMPPSQAGADAEAGSDALTQDASSALNAELAMVRSQLAGVEAAMEAGTLDTSDPVIAQLQESRAALEQDYARITEQFRPEYPAARDVRENIEQIDASLTREAFRLSEDRAIEARQLRQREVDITAQINALGLEVGARGEAGEGLGTMGEDVTAKRDLYELLLARLALAEDDQRPVTARIIAQAVPPAAPAGPGWPLLIGMALGAALLLSLGWLALDSRRRRKL